MFSDLPTFSHIQQAKTKPELASTEGYGVTASALSIG